MDDDPTLSMAFTSALRSTVVPSLRLNGHFTAIKRLFLDSRLLANELGRIDAETDRRTRQTEEPFGPEPLRADTSARDIPIFIFSLDYPLPVFVDKHYQSKPVEGDMVVAVQSNHHLWESHLSCNNKPIYWNLRDPVRAIVSSVAYVLAGVLPAHVTHLPPHTRPAQEWSWAVGTSPLTHTSSGLTFSAIHRDTTHRSYIVTALRRVTAQLNTAINRLRHHHTTPNNYALSKRRSLLRPLKITPEALGLLCDQLGLPESLHPLTPDSGSSDHAPGTSADQMPAPTDVRVLQILYHAVRARINGLWHDVGDLEYESATAKIPPLLTLSNQFSRAVDLFALSASDLECVDVSPTADDVVTAAAAAAAAGTTGSSGIASIYWVITLIGSIAIGLARWLRRPPAKPHIN